MLLTSNKDLRDLNLSYLVTAKFDSQNERLCDFYQSDQHLLSYILKIFILIYTYLIHYITEKSLGTIYHTLIFIVAAIVIIIATNTEHLIWK